MMHGFGFGGYGMGAFGWVGMILNLVITLGLIVGVVLLVIWLVRRLASGSQGPTSYPAQPAGTLTPHEIVQIRYARGEITREQYQEMLADLG